MINQEEIRLVDIARLLYQRRIFVLVLVLAAIGASYTVSVFSRPVFRAQVTGIVPKTEGQSQVSSILTGIGFSNLGGSGSSAAQIKAVLQSRRMRREVVLNFLPSYHLVKNSLFYTPNYAAETDPWLLPAADLEGLLGRIESAVKIQFAADTDILTVEVQDGDPKLCAALANFYVEHLDALNEDLHMSTSKPIVQILDPAVVPLGPFKPDIRLNVSLAAAGSLVAAAFLIFLAEFALSLLKAVREP